MLVRRAAVLGAGVMGAQIAAHLVNARIPVLLFDLAAPEGAANAQIERAIDNLRKMEPAPLAQPELPGKVDVIPSKLWISLKAAFCLGRVQTAGKFGGSERV